MPMESQKSSGARPTSGRPAFPPRTTGGYGIPFLIANNPRLSVLLAALSVLVSLLRTPAGAGEHWPQFRGPGSTGVSTSTGLPDRWSRSENVVWKVAVPGRGWSSPIVWGDRIFLTAAIQEEGETEPAKKGLYLFGERPAPTQPHRWMVYCFDWASGKMLWQRVAARGVPKYGRHLKNSFASETPVTDGQRVYAWFGNVGVFCYDFEGKELWSRKLGEFPMRLGWGTASSPALDAGRLYIVNDNEQHSFLAILDAATGKEIRRVDRDEKSNWSTPLVWRHAGRTEVVTTGSNRVRSYDPEGKLLWEMQGMSVITIPTPLVAHDLLYVTSGYVMDIRRPLVAIRPGAAGDISLKPEETGNRYVAWRQPMAGPYNPSPLVYGDHVYVLYDRGQLACFDARSGKEVYGKTRLSEKSRAFTASPWAYEGKLFCLSEDGDTYVVQAGPQFKLLRTNALEELSLATPAIVRQSLILRTETSLYRIEAKGAEGSGASKDQ